jgi:hypothetical protein
MRRLSFHRRLAALGLAAALTAPWTASAAPRARQESHTQPRTVTQALLGQLWSLWAHWFPVELPETLDAGCHLDPDGHCVPGSSSLALPETLDEGCHLDPDGRCRSGS